MVAKKYSPTSFHYKFLHLISEIELVFIFWSLVLSFIIVFFYSLSDLTHFYQSLSFEEPLFVFAIVLISASRPVLNLAKALIELIAKCLPFSSLQSQFFTTMFFGPLFGSLITEPAAMTVVSLLLAERFRENKFSKQFKYAVLAILLVSISVGGTLTHFAAPPVIMVSKHWGLTTSKMFWRFGYKAILCIFILVSFLLVFFRKEIRQFPKDERVVQFEIGLIEIAVFLTLGLCVLFAHRMEFILLILIIFFLLAYFFKEKIGHLNIKNALFISLFLIGLMILGSTQKWWLMLVMTKFHDWQLYLASASLTAVIDNAALTFLGSLTTLSDQGQSALLAGAVVGGGLTVMANAPNPIAFNSLKKYFENEEIDSFLLLKWTFLPTSITLLVFWFLPSLA